jgi:hypothetical protein
VIEAIPPGAAAGRNSGMIEMRRHPALCCATCTRRVKACPRTALAPHTATRKSIRETPPRLA